MAKPATMWLTPNVVVASASSSPPNRPPTAPPSDRHPRPVLPAPPAGEHGAEDHHPLEADVDGAAALGVQAAEAARWRSARRCGSPRSIVPAEVRSLLSVIDASDRDRPAPSASAPRSHIGPGDPDRDAAGAPARWTASVAAVSDDHRRGLSAARSAVASAQSARRRLPRPSPSSRRPRPCAARPRRRSTAASRNEPCRMMPISCGMPMTTEPLRRPLDRRPDERGGGDPDRVVAPEQRERQPGEAEALRELVAVLAVLRIGEQRREPDQPGDAAGDQDRHQHHPLRVDAGRRGRRRVLRPTPAGRSRSGCG